MKPVLSLTDVWLRYDSHQPWVLRGINIHIDEGDWVTILGANGSGKSSFIRLMNGLLQPTKGEVIVCGMSASEPEKFIDIRKEVGMVFQNAENQIVGITVEEDTSFGLYNLGFPSDEIASRCREVWSLLGLPDKQDSPPHFLSGGEKQKLAIAGVLVMRPRIILFDEPASMLDAISTRQLYALMTDLHQKGCTIIVVTNEVEDMFYGNRLVMMHEGDIRYDGPPLEAVKHSSIFKDCRLLPPFRTRMRDIAANWGIESWLESVE
ncbi:energy-coupling factor ABC transporter ATP-binding protein [Paenibacillus sp. XY044]|uniref:energy-coupling factor ABC transporter ATP-binding protein n=1 Tax=Paenibacillus sp. XY044 TaxID=2026089 RepID=UPI00211B3290|nr:energy-coupling factor ABC transporter ATP-binding protein [Paenibacillus sp. XY044]